MIRILPIVFLLSISTAFAQVLDEMSPAKDLIQELRRIHTPNGIESLEQIELNGSQQWISIRGKDRNNPVLLFLHGGPASPTMPTAWAFQGPWEDYFTVVQWDQRAAGKNWLNTDTTAVAAELHFRTLIQDAYQLVEHLRLRFGQEKIFLMGYSYGAGIGIRMAARIPEKLHAYIGIGQMAPGNPEAVIYQTLLRLAQDAQNTEALEELRSLAPYPNPNGQTPVGKLLAVRKWSRKFNGGWYGKSDFELLFALPSLSPEYTIEDIDNLAKSTPWISRRILSNGGAPDFPQIFDIPMILMMGRHDLHTPYESAIKYWESISAPSKQVITFDFSGHVPFLEEPGKFLVELVNKVKPLAD